jgi:hypothetical protein
MNKKLLSALMLFSSFPAFAGGGSSVGSSACSFAAVACHTNQSSITEQTWVCIFRGPSESQYSALVATPNGDDTPPFEVTLQPAQPGVLGAPEVFVGNGLELVYGVDASEHPGYLTVPSQGLHNLPMVCR